MKWNEFRDFALVAMVVFNICLIVIFGHIGNRNTIRIDSLEIRQSGVESALDVGILEVHRAVLLVQNEAIRLSGVDPEEIRVGQKVTP